MGRIQSCVFIHIFTDTNDGFFKSGYVRVKECPQELALREKLL